MITRRMLLAALPLAPFGVARGSWHEQKWEIKDNGQRVIGALIARNDVTGEERRQEFQVETTDGGPLDEEEKKLAVAMAQARLHAWLERLNAGKVTC